MLENLKKCTQVLLITTVFVSCGKGDGSGDSSESIQTQNQVKQESKYSLTNPYFENEYSLKTFSKEKRILSDIDSRYYQVTEFKNKEVKTLNYIEYKNGVTNLEISGKRILIKKNMGNDIYTKLSRRTDLGSLVVEADTVEIHDPLFLHQTKVLIKARKLSFVGGGMIDTTAISKTVPAAQFQNGIDGLNAGEIKIIADQVFSEDKLKIYLKANGGNGQPAGLGQNGAPGRKTILIKGSFYGVRERYCSEEFRGGRGERKRASRCVRYSHKGWRMGRAPENGKHAIVGGKPGEPGKPAQITFNKNFDLRVQMLGGEAGKKDVLRIGGAPSNPSYACKNFEHVRIEACVQAVKGNDIEPKSAVIDKERSIELVQLVDENWFNKGFLNNELRYISDVYMANRLSVAYRKIKSLRHDLNDVDDKSFSHTNAIQELDSLQNRIELRKDFFGNSKAWTPNIGLEVNYKVFKDEVRKSIEILFATKKIELSIKNEELKKEHVKNLQKLLYADISLKNKKLSTLATDSVRIKEDINDLLVSQEGFEQELIRVEREIQKLAEKNLAPPKSNSFLKTLSAIAKVVPVGQPALGAAAMGVDFLTGIQANNASAVEIATDINSIYQDFKQINWNKSLSDINTKIDDLSPRHLEGMDNWKDRISHINDMYKFVSPMITTFNEHAKQSRKREVPKSVLEAEIGRIKQSHSVYNSLISKLNKLLVKKEKLQAKFTKFSYNFEKMVSSVNSNYLTIANTFENLSEISTSRKSDFSLQIKNVREKALHRLSYYQYLFEKSYEYRLLKTYNMDNDLKVIVEKVEKLIMSENQSVQSSIEFVESLYLSMLSDITESIYVHFLENGPGYTLQKDYRLTQEELNSLNKGEEFYLDFTGEEFFGNNKENVRIERIFIPKLTDLSSTRNEDLEIVFSHHGQSVISKNSDKYFFEINGMRGNANAKWLTFINGYTGETLNSTESNSDIALFKTLLNMPDLDTSYFVKPGARTFIKVKARKSDDSKIGNLTVRIEYTADIKSN